MVYAASYTVSYTVSYTMWFMIMCVRLDVRAPEAAPALKFKEHKVMVKCFDLSAASAHILRKLQALYITPVHVFIQLSPPIYIVSSTPIRPSCAPGI